MVAVGESDYGDSFFEEGAYHIAVWEPAAYGESGTGIWATDFYAEVDTELVQDDLGWSSHGLMFRWTGPGTATGSPAQAIGTQSTGWAMRSSEPAISTTRRTGSRRAPSTRALAARIVSVSWRKVRRS